MFVLPLEAFLGTQSYNLEDFLNMLKLNLLFKDIEKYLKNFTIHLAGRKECAQLHFEKEVLAYDVRGKSMSQLFEANFLVLTFLSKILLRN